MFKLPDEAQNLVIQHSGNEDREIWWIGDFTRDIVDELHPQKIKKGDIRKEVARLARKKVATIREREWISRRIPEKKRTYELSVSQYRHCLNAGDRWEEFAQKAVEFSDEHGGWPAPIEAIDEWIYGSHAETPLSEKLWDEITVRAERILEEIDVPEWMQIACKMIVGAEEK